MRKQLFAATAVVLALTAWAEKPTIVLGTETLEIDTIFHAKVGPGTTQTQLHLSGQHPLDVFYLTVDKTAPGVSIHAVCPGGKMAGNMRTSGMAETNSNDSRLYFCGTNADFYWTSGKATDGSSLVGTPTYSAAVDGEVYRSSSSGYQFSVDAEGIARVCRLSWGDGTATKGDRTVAFKGVNNDAVNNGITLYTTRGWTSPCMGQYAGSCAEVTARLVDGQKYETGGSFQVQVTGAPTSTGDTPIPADGCVLMARGNAVDFVNALQPGDIITLDQVIKTPEGQRITPMQIVSGNPKNVGGGVNLNSEGERGDAKDRHPRTGIGVSQDGNTIIMMVVDGRGASYGVTTGMLGDLLIRAGAYESVNLDGGGSSTLYTAALGVRNKCSDGNERAVGNGIFAVVDGNVRDTEVASLEFKDWRMDLPQMGMYTPTVFAYNAAGVMIDKDFKDFTLSCPETLGEISADGKSLFATGTQHGVLTATFGNAAPARIPVYISAAEIQPRLSSVLLDLETTYTVELQALVQGNTISVSPSAYDWSSSDAAVATVSEDGVVTPVGAGTCTVTGSHGEQSFDIEVKVEARPGDVVPVESAFEGWTVAKTLVSTVSASLLENGLALDYTMGSSVRSPKITLTDRKNLTARPTGLQIRMTSATATPKQFALTFRPANQRININVNFTEFPGDGTASWVLPFADYMDIDDAAVYPVEFVSLAVVPGDAAKATGHIDLPGIEVLYTGDLGGVENVTVNAAGGPEGWYTIQGVSLPARPTAPGLYIHRTATYTAKVAIR